MGNYTNIDDRKQLINNIVKEYQDKSAPSIIFIRGNHGQGKSYILDSIINKVSQLTFINILKNLDNDLIYEIGKKPLKKGTINAANISLGNSVFTFGIGLEWDNQFYYGKIRNSLSKFLSTDLLICIDDISDVSDNIRCFITNIIKCADKLQIEFKKNIYFLISDSLIDYSDSFIKYNLSYKIIDLPRYNYEDIKYYLTEYKCESNITEESLLQIYDLSQGNLNLVDFLYEETVQESKDFVMTLKDIVYKRLMLIKKQGKLKDISEKNMENIIFSAALALKKFSAEFLNKILQEENINFVKEGLEIARKEDLINKNIEKYYFFISKDIQDYLANLSCEKNENLLISYYNYYTLNEIDNYYSRAYYILKYQEEITSFSFSLLIMAYSSAKKMQDILKLEKIQILFDKYDRSENFKNDFNLIKNFYDKLLVKSPFNEIFDIYHEICNRHWEIVILALVSLEYFHYLYRYCIIYEPKNIKILNNCINYAMNPLKLNTPNIDGLIETNESCLQLYIIYQIAPCILDYMNNYDQFNILYNKSKELSYDVKLKRNGLGEYIENIFNRKAFLFVNQTACDYYYEKAKSYFYNNEIWIEYYITLICQAGTDIVIQAYEDALENCEKVKTECKEKNIILPQIEKMYNNEIIAEFLLSERNASTEKKAIASAKKALTKLKKLINDDKNATQFVIYTNICSLSLYCGNEKQYMKYKTALEKKYGCLDISNVNDQSIDDFYRYYFAWFEIYRLMNHEDWSTMKLYVNAISDFVPSLFKKQEIFWDKKNEAVLQLIKHKKKISAYDFCHNLVKTNRQEQILSKFFYRGLMISDLQYTSYF